MLWVVAAHLVFLPWALGTMRLWAQWISLGFAGVGFVLALVPREYSEEHTGSNRFRLIMWPKLIKFPLFWIGLALLAYITLQGLNPSWQYTRHPAGGWYIVPIANIEWLPTSVRAPFKIAGPWRQLLIYGAAWLTVCTLWVGFTRRRTVQLLLITLAANGLALAVFGIAQRMLGNERIFWFVTSPNPSFFASFIYKNHAGAYLLLALAITCGLAGWYYLRGLRRMEKSNPSGVFAFAATCIAVSILTSYARGVTVVMLLFLVACVATFLVHQFGSKSENRKPVVAVVLLLVFGYFLKTGLEAVQSHEAWNRLHVGLTRQDTSLASRELASQATLEMLRERWSRGVGAGSFRFAFPRYQHRYPKLVKNEFGEHQYWEYAHNDILQIPAELGVGGMLIGLAAIAWIGASLVRSYFWASPLSACMVFGTVALVCYSWWDFPFYCPAVIVTSLVVVIIAVIWARFEEQGTKA